MEVGNITYTHLPSLKKPIEVTFIEYNGNTTLIVESILTSDKPSDVGLFFMF